MSEIVTQQQNALLVSGVVPESPAMLSGVMVGDLLRAINAKPILDILDYRFHSANSRLNLTLERDGVVLHRILEKEPYTDAGLKFGADLGDKIHTCKNKCVFCFIHQQPKKMRRSLYLMDDDFRLSFMHGNYVTLTNITEAEWKRILEQKLSPLYVSVHATNPELRGKLLGRKEPTPILPQIQELADNGIDVHAQIVLCPGLNDGDALDETLNALAAEHRLRTRKQAGVPSVAIVPVGMTRFRERLPQLQKVEQEYARRMLSHIERHQNNFMQSLGTRFVWLADEWRYIAKRPYPTHAHYEDFPQLEDGIGTSRLFLDNLASIARRLPTKVEKPIKATLVTAEMPSALVQRLADRLNRIIGVEVNVCVVANTFFGGDIHIAGLLTAQDILATLEAFPQRYESIYLPKICLRDDGLFLDDISLPEARERSGLDLRVTGNRPSDLVTALGLIAPRRSKTQERAHWLIEAETDTDPSILEI